MQRSQRISFGIFMGLKLLEPFTFCMKTKIPYMLFQKLLSI